MKNILGGPQVAQHDVKHDGYCILSQSVYPGSELVRVEGGRQVVLAIVQDQLFQALGDDECEYNWVVVLVANDG